MTGFFSKTINGDEIGEGAAVGGRYSVPIPTFPPKIIHPSEITRHQSNWPSVCAVCARGCVSQICNACKPSFDRGLVKTKVLIDTKVTLSDINGLRSALRDYRIENGKDPSRMIMNPETFVTLQNEERSIGQIGSDHLEIYGITCTISNDMPTWQIAMTENPLPEEITTTLTPATHRIQTRIIYS
jgi:hypothetical protein